MKGVNLKKLGAILAGTAILAGSLAFAGAVTYNGIQLVDDSGSPAAKVVVGSQAAVSDAVAASQIAQFLANKAYVTKTYTAKVTGQDQLSCSGSSEGSSPEASCTVSDESVTLEVTVPGVSSTAVHNFGLLIAEDADKDLGDRDADYYNYEGDLLDDEPNPFQDQNGGELNMDGAETNYQAYMIDGNKLGAFNTYEVKSSKFGITANEYERAYFKMHTEFDGDDQIVVPGENVVYQIVFGPSDQGIPLCPGDTSKTVSECDDNQGLGAARYQIRFAGSDWIISDIDSLTSTSTTATTPSLSTDKVVGLPDDGFTIKLAKEAAYGIVNVGSSLKGEGYEVSLDDISRDDTQHNPAIISIKDGSGNVVAQDQIKPGTTKEVSLGNGEKLTIHVYQTAPGYTLGAKWAEMAILKDEIRLEEGKEFMDYADKDSNYKVYLGFTDKNGANTGLMKDVTNLKEITFVGDADLYGSDDNQLEPGDSVPVLDLDGYNAYELKYNGLETEDDGIEFDTLSFQYSDGTKNNQDLYDLATDSSYMDDVDLEGYIKVSSSLEKAFENSNQRSGEVLVGLAQNFDSGETDSDGTPIYVKNLPVVLLKRADGGYYAVTTKDDVTVDTTVAGGAATVDATDTVSMAAATEHFTYKQAGRDNGDLSVAVPAVSHALAATDITGCDDGLTDTPCIVTVSAADGGTLDGETLSLVEDIGEIANNDETGTISFVTSGGKFVDSGGDDEKIDYVVSAAGYDQYGYSAAPGNEEDTGFISMRGTEFKSATDSKRVFSVPDKVREAKFVFKPTAEASESSSTQTVTLREGDEHDFGGGVKVKVASIDEKATASVSGTGAAGSCAVSGADQLGAVITDGQTFAQSTLEAATVNDVKENLVVLDSDAADVGTKIVVGGPAVNSVAAEAFSNAGLELSPDNSVIVQKVDEKTIVVAGYTAEDTQSAVKQFLDSVEVA